MSYGRWARRLGLARGSAETRVVWGRDLLDEAWLTAPVILCKLARIERQLRLSYVRDP
jgi:hypothetical protein